MIHPYIYAGTFEDFNYKDNLNLATILQEVANYFELDYEELKNKKTKLREYTYPRQLYAYFAKRYTKRSLIKIGAFINKNHATIIHSNKEISKFYEIDKNTRRDVRKLNNILKNKTIKNNPTELDAISREIILKYQKL